MRFRFSSAFCFFFSANFFFVAAISAAAFLV